MMKQQVTVTILTTIMILNHLGVEVELTNKNRLDGQVFHKTSQESNSSQQSETSATSRAGTLLENVTDQNGPNFQNGQNGRKISDQNGQNGRNGAERESSVDGKSGNKVSLR